MVEYADKVEGIAGGTPIPVTGAAGAPVVVDTELPAAVIMSDALASAPTNPSVAAYGVVVNAGTGNGERSRVASADGMSVTGLPAAAGMMFNVITGLWDRVRGSSSAGLLAEPTPASAVPITVAGAANAIATATLPAPGAGLRQYITHIRIRRIATAALAGGAILTVTTTNLNNRQWRCGNQASITVSASEDLTLMDQEFTHALRADNGNTAVTIVCPAAGAAVSWDINVEYYIAP